MSRRFFFTATAVIVAGCAFGVAAGRWVRERHDLQADDGTEFSAMVADASLTAEAGVLATDFISIESSSFWAILEQLESAVDDSVIKRLADEARSDLERRAVLSWWVERDPQAALAWGTAASTPFATAGGTLEARQLIFQEWAKLDPYAAIHAVRSDASPLASKSHYAILNALADTHPEAFFDALEAFGSSPAPNAWDAAFATMFAQDPALARGEYEALRPGDQYAARRAFGRQWAMVDPLAALAWVDEMGASVSKSSDPFADGGQVNTDVLFAVLESVALADPMTALRRASAAHRMPGGVNEAISSGFAKWPPDQIIEAFVAFEQADENDISGSMRGAVHRVLQATMKEDPAQAFALIERIPDERLRASITTDFAQRCSPDRVGSVMHWLGTRQLSDDALRRVGAQLAVKLFDPSVNQGNALDPESLAASLAVGPVKEALQQAIDADTAVCTGDYATFAAWLEPLSSATDIAIAQITRLKSESIAEAVSLVEHLESPFHRKDFLLESLMSEWFDRNPEAARAWAENPPQSIKDHRKPALNLASAWAAYDPRQAAAWAMTLTGERQADVVDSIASAWARQDPAAVVEWATSLEDPSLRAQASGSLGRVWLNDDPYSTTQWLASLERGDIRDKTITGIVKNVRLSKHMDLPERTAIRWLADIDQTELRRSSITTLVGEDHLRDPGDGRPAVEAMLRDAGIADTDIQAVYSMADSFEPEEADFDDPFGGSE